MIFRNRESRLKKQAGFLCKEADLFSRIPHFSEHPIRDHPGDPHSSRSIDAVDDHAHLHPFVPDVSRRTGEHGKDAGKDHYFLSAAPKRTQEMASAAAVIKMAAGSHGSQSIRVSYIPSAAFPYCTISR